MTRLHATVALIGAATASLAISHIVLWRKNRRNDEYMDAMKEYVSRMVDTDCGRVAFQTIVDGAAEEEKEEDTGEAVDWSDFSVDEPIPYDLTDKSLPEDDEGMRRLYTKEALKRFHDK